MVAGAFAGGAALAMPLLLPELVRRRILSTLGERTGMSTELADVDLGWSSVTMTGLSLQGRGIDARFDTIDVDLDPITALSGDLSALEAVVVDGGSIRVSPDPAIDDADPASAGTSSTSSRTLPRLELHGVSLSLADDVGELIRVGTLDATLVSDGASRELDVTAQAIEVDGGPVWSASHAELAMIRDEDGLSVRRAALGRARLHLARDETNREERLRALVRRVRGPRASETDADADRGIMARLTDDFTGGIEALSIEVEDASANVESMELSLVRVGDRLTSTGSGTLADAGRIDWHLDVEPDALLATGSIDLSQVSLAVLTPFLPHLPFYAPEDTTISGTLSLARADLAGVQASGSLETSELGFSHPRIAPEPIEHIALAIRGTASWAPLSRELTIGEVFVRAGPSAEGMGRGAEARIAGTVVWEPERYAVDVVATLPPTPCNDAVHAIPSGLLGELSGFTMTGRIGGAIELDLDSSDLDATRMRVRVADECRFVSVPALAEPSRFERPFHHRVEENDGDIFEMDTGPGTFAWTPIADTSPFFLHAVLAHEDASFFRHHGFAPWAIRDALVANLRAGRYVRGASTITMQLVKNAFLHREKTLARKVQEVLLTWWVESSMTKEAILQLYVNVIELGNGVYGIRDAAMSWFGRTPGELSAAESVFLAMILPNPPELGAEARREGRPPEALRRRMANFLRHLGETGSYGADTVEAGLLEIDTMRFFHPDEAPPGPRALTGSTAALPIGFGAGGIDGFGMDGFEPDAYETDAFEGDTVEPDALEAEGDSGHDGDDDGDDEREGGETSWDRWEEIVP
jgi:hypothetical protein